MVKDTTRVGNLQIDLVEHCGSSTRGEYICTLSATDISTGWFEGAAVMGKSQHGVFTALKSLRTRFPFKWRHIHTDNGTEFINDHLYQYCKKEIIGFSRSRPYKKNDNCFVEQKNWTHVKRFVGYYRYDTKKELSLLNELYENGLRVYKNFFQTIMKLESKERIGGKLHRRYEEAKTPFHRVIEYNELAQTRKRTLQKIYESENPAQLKRTIDKKLQMLYQAYQYKQNSS